MSKRKRMKQSSLFVEPQHQKRDAVFTLRCEPATLDKLRAKAKALGISANAFLRFALEHALAFDVVRVGIRNE